MKTTVILDSNLLVLFVVGSTHRSYITKHKKLKSYSESDYDLLLKIVENADKVIVTPNTLTETSNMIGYAHDPMRTELFQTFQALINGSEELHIESRTAANGQVFLRLGITDSALFESCNKEISLVTSDLDLYLAAVTKGASAINFNHLRELQGTV